MSIEKEIKTAIDAMHTVGDNVPIEHKARFDSIISTAMGLVKDGNTKGLDKMLDELNRENNAK